MEVIVINDGSNDRTGEIARTLPVTLIEHETSRGYGASLKDGLRQAKGEMILIGDADGTYPLEEIPRVAADMTGVDMIIAAGTGELVKSTFSRWFEKWS